MRKPTERGPVENMCASRPNKRRWKTSARADGTSAGGKHLREPTGQAPAENICIVQLARHFLVMSVRTRWCDPVTCRPLTRLSNMPEASPDQSLRFIDCTTRARSNEWRWYWIFPVRCRLGDASSSTSFTCFVNDVVIREGSRTTWRYGD